MTGFDEMWPIRWSPTIASRSSSIDEDRVGRAVAGPLPDEEAPAAGLDDVAVPDRPIDGDGAAVDAVLLGDGVELGDRGLGNAVQAHHVGLVGVLELHRAREVGEEPGQELVRDDGRAAALAHRVREPDVVVVLVGEDDLLDVLDAGARAPRATPRARPASRASPRPGRSASADRPRANSS